MKKSMTVPALLLVALACQRPEVEAFRQHPAPVRVSLVLPEGLPEAQAARMDYASALRARLATRVTVVPEDVAPPPGAVELEVRVTRLDEGRPRADPSPVAVGVTTGVVVGALSAASGNRGSFWDGLFWGFWAGGHAAAERDFELRRLGYAPSRVNAVVTLRQPGADPRHPLYEFDISGSEVVNAMDGLRREDAEDPARVREEEAKALARVVVWRLQEKFEWRNHGTPSFYRPASPEAPPPPKAEPEPSLRREAAPAGPVVG